MGPSNVFTYLLSTCIGGLKSAIISVAPTLGSELLHMLSLDTSVYPLYSYVHMSSYVYKHTFTHELINIYIYIYIRVLIHEYVYMHIPLYIFVYVYMYDIIAHSFLCFGQNRGSGKRQIILHIYF